MFRKGVTPPKGGPQEILFFLIISETSRRRIMNFCMSGIH